jgi:type II secretory pathway pseudopilin PulG
MRPDRMRRDGLGTEDGFLLVEAVVAVSVVTIVMSALVALLVTVTRSTDQQRSSQVAAHIAVGALDRARGVGAAGAVSGRDQSSATTQFTRTPASLDYPATSSDVAPWLADMVAAVDATAPIGAGATAALPTSAQHQLLNGVDYRLNYYVGYCWRAASGPDCVKTQTSGAIQYVRVVAAVTWAGPGCTGVGCSYLSATLLHESTEPIFNFNQAPPPQPVIKTVPAQDSAVGEAVNGISGVAGCAVPCPVVTTDGVPPFVFTATGLPPGLSIDPSGLITGTPTAIGVYAVQVKVVDAFLSTASTSFNWTVYAPLVFDQPAAQHSVAGNAVSVDMTGASGGTGSGYAWSATGLPPGLSINTSSGRIAGTLSTSSGSSTPYQVAVTLSDSSGRSTSHSFTWTVDFAPLAAAPADQTSTVGRAITPLPTSSLVTGGSGDVAWAGPVSGLPVGLQVAPDGKSITGTPSATGKTTVSGTVTDAVTGESVAVSFSWTVYAQPTLTNPGSQSLDRRSTSTLQMGYTCPNGPCTFTLSANSSARLSIDAGTGLVTAASGASKGSYSVTVTITDAAGASAAVTFTWSRT